MLWLVRYKLEVGEVLTRGWASACRCKSRDCKLWVISRGTRGNAIHIVRIIDGIATDRRVVFYLGLFVVCIFFIFYCKLFNFQ